MKLIGFLRGSGKVGSIVVKTVNGQPIASEYQPQVANPSTRPQVNQRARLKLMSQLAAALAPVIAIPKEGNVSARNGFIARNIKYAYAADGNAQVTYENLQLTAGNTALPSLVATRTTGASPTLTLKLADAPGDAVSRIVFAVFVRSSENKLMLVKSVVQTEKGTDGDYAVSMEDISGDLILFAYGIKDVSATAQATYGEMSIASGEDIARLVASRNISMTDYQFTQTRGITLQAGETESTTIGPNQARVYLTPSGPGTVSGAGIFNIGDSVTVTATPNSGARFAGWKVNGSQAILSSNASYTFTLNGQMDLIASFYIPNPDEGME